MVGIGIYSWDPVTGALDWDERLHEMWGLPPDAPVDMEVFEAGIHPDDLTRVREAIAACVDPDGDGHYSIEYRVIGRDDRVTRHIATSGTTTFREGAAVGFIGAAIDVTAQRRTEAAIRSSEAQFRSFAQHSSNLIWIGDPAAGTITYRSAAFETIWGLPDEAVPTALADWMNFVHPEDRQQVERALDTVRSGEVAQYEFRIIRPRDGTIRWLRDTSFPIRDEHGAVARIGGIAEDLTPQDLRRSHLVSTKRPRPVVSRRSCETSGIASERSIACPLFSTSPPYSRRAAYWWIRGSRLQGLSIPRELKARSITLSAILLDGPGRTSTPRSPDESRINRLPDGRGR